jgi:hypothetical protein
MGDILAVLASATARLAGAPRDGSRSSTLGIQSIPKENPAKSAASGAGGVAIPDAAAEHKLTEEVQWGRCRYWRRVCAFRWGWRTLRFFRCMGRHAC